MSPSASDKKRQRKQRKKAAALQTPLTPSPQDSGTDVDGSADQINTRESQEASQLALSQVATASNGAKSQEPDGVQQMLVQVAKVAPADGGGGNGGAADAGGSGAGVDMEVLCPSDADGDSDDDGQMFSEPALDPHWRDCPCGLFRWCSVERCSCGNTAFFRRELHESVPAGFKEMAVPTERKQT